MGNGMNKVLPGLYQGSQFDSEDESQLSEHGITHILSLTDTPEAKYSSRIYKLVACDDNPKQDMRQHFSGCIRFIHETRAAGGNVLVHCIAGISRASTITLAYLLSTTTLDLPVLMSALKQARSVSNPNHGFVKQLETYAASKDRRDAAATLGTLDSALIPLAVPRHIDNATKEAGDAPDIDDAVINDDESYLLTLASGENPDVSLAGLKTRTIMWMHGGKLYLVDESNTDVFTTDGTHVGKRRIDPESPIDYDAVRTGGTR